MALCSSSGIVICLFSRLLELLQGFHSKNLYCRDPKALTDTHKPLWVGRLLNPSLRQDLSKNI